MSTRIVVAMLLALVQSLAGALAAEPETDTPRMRGIDQPIETNTASLNLPRSVPGFITLRACDEFCPVLTLQITETSTFFLGRSAVGFTELQQFAQSAAGNVTVLYDPATNVITRIIAGDGTR